MKRLHEFYTAGTGTAMLIGNPQAAAINAPQGKKYDAWKDAYGNALVDRDIGGAAGLVAGAGIGAGAGALAMRTKTGKRVAAKLSSGGDMAERLARFKNLKQVATPVGALVGGLAGLGIGGYAGLVHGHYGKRAQEIRNRHLSANLKPALRELAARSGRITEFAMVRDANGQFVEVEDEGGMGMGTAIKAGAGAAALGGAGYGAYRADEAIMGKYGKQGLLNGLPSNYTTDSVAKTGVATRGQAYRSAFKDIGNSATSRVRQGWAAGNAAYNAAGRRASAALPVEASGFGAKLLRGIRKGLSVATKMA